MQHLSSSRSFDIVGRSRLLRVAIALSVSCAIPEAPDTPVPLPDERSFVDAGVSQFMERRCGGLDCHGQAGRPLRLYASWGLRLELASDDSRTMATTAKERHENYLAVVGLEPEQLSRCFQTNGADDHAQLILKPLDAENGGIRHKGGPVLRPIPTDPGWQCLYGWASGSVDASACAKAASLE